MDILKSIQHAEKQAADMEQKFKAEADALLASVPDEVARLRAEREARLEREIQDRRAESEKKLQAEKAAVMYANAGQREALTRKAAATMKKAVVAFLGRLGL